MLLIEPDAEIADVEHVVKAYTQRLLEDEDIVVEPVHGSVDVAGGTDERDFLVALPVGPRLGCSVTPGKRQNASTTCDDCQ